MKRAFDSVAKPVLAASWMRLGVPHDIATWLTNMDTNGKTVIRSPLAQETWYSLGYKGFNQEAKWLDPTAESPSVHECTDSPATFDCERGTGQGDVGSPSNWAAFMDILLVALEEVKDGLFYTADTFQHQATGENAFADDMISTTSRHKSLQDKADIVSAFAAIFGMEIRVDKLRLMHYDFSAEEPGIADPLPLILHSLDPTTGWTPVEAPISIEGNIKHLGVIHCPHGDYNQQFEATEEMIQSESKIIATRRAPKHTKIMTLRLRTFNRAKYAAKFCSWRLEQYKELEIPINKSARSILHLLPSHPSYLIQCPRNRGGAWNPLAK